MLRGASISRSEGLAWYDAMKAVEKAKGVEQLRQRDDDDNIEVVKVRARD